jgi:hypothetical protein
MAWWRRRGTNIGLMMERVSTTINCGYHGDDGDDW